MIKKIKYISNPTILNKMKAQSLKLFENEYNWENEKRKLQKVYTEMVS